MIGESLKVEVQHQIACWRVRIRRAFHSPGYVWRELKNTLRALAQVDYRFLDGYSFYPNFVTAILTYRCNLRCRMCFLYEQGSERDLLAPFVFPNELSLDQWKEIVDQVAFFKPHIQLVGGEPFLYRGAVDLIRYIKKKGLTCAVNTNGFFLARFADELVDSGIDWVTVSIDGPPEVHNEVRVHPKGFQVTMKNVQALLEARRRAGRQGPIVSINCVISNLNYTRLRELIPIAQELGVDQIEFQGLMFANEEIARRQAKVLYDLFGIEPNQTSVEGYEHNLAAGIDLKRLQEEIAAIRHYPMNGMAVRFHPAGIWNHLAGYYGDLNYTFPRQRCTAPWREIQILPNGDVSACWGLPEIVVGNIVRDGFEKIWNGEKMREFRRKLRERGLFPNCARCCRRDY